MIYVGKVFLGGMTERHFARRVLQVGHELEHITQWRSGMGGGKKKSEREFLPFQHEGLGAEKAGTGRVTHATRVDLIDAALGHFYCLTPEKQKEYATAKDDLLARRAAEVTASKRDDQGDPPTQCKTS